MEISLCMIVRNEEAVLGRCLACVKDVMDEIVIVDTGSDDRTKEIAHTYTPLVYDFAWVDDFAKARNFAFSKATKPYIMWLDADDVMEPEAVARLKALKENIDPAVDVVMMPYRVAFDRQGNPTMAYQRERIIKRSAGLQWVGAIHEVIPPAGKVMHADIPVLHKKLAAGDPNRNLRIFEKLAAQGHAFSPREQYYYARELMYHKRWEDAVAMFSKYLQEDKGWLENKISACQDMADCLRGLGREQEAMAALFSSFRYDAPRAETCCKIGLAFFQKQQYPMAAFWYELAASKLVPRPSSGFIQPDCYGYVPYMQLCVCYHKMGDLKRAAESNRLAGEIKPEDPGYLYNKAFFEKAMKETGAAES